MGAIKSEAELALGETVPGDYILKPEAHSEILPPEAGALKRVLRGELIRKIIEQYNAHSTKAAAAQRSYKRLAKTAAIASFIAILMGSAFVIAGNQLLPASAGQAATILQAVLVVISLGLSVHIGYAKPFETWMEARAAAENARHDLFDEVMKAEEAPGGLHPDELPLLPLQLEYFRRYQLEVQRNYYRGRGTEHLAASAAARNWRIAALVLVVLSALPALWGLQGKEWLPDLFTKFLQALPEKSMQTERAFLAISLIASGLQGLLAAYALITLNDRNAARYLATAENLDFLTEKHLAEARKRAAGGDRPGVLSFVALVQQEISSEHREWIVLRKIAPDLTLSRLATLRLPKVR
jgi:hypothetical protein